MLKTGIELLGWEAEIGQRPLALSDVRGTLSEVIEPELIG